MVSLAQKITIEDNCFYQMFLNLAELHKKECIGDLIGESKAGQYIVTGAHPTVNILSTSYTVDYLDIESRQRVTDMAKSIRKIGKFKGIIGQYHTHVHFQDERRTYFWNADALDFRKVMLKDGLEDSLQLVLSLRIRDTKTKNKPYERSFNYARKLRVWLRTESGIQYSLIIAGYRLTHFSIEELKIKRKRAEVNSLANIIRQREILA